MENSQQKSVKMKNSKNKKKWVSFSCPKDHSTQKLGVRYSPRTHRQTHRQTRKWLLWAPFQGFRSFSFNLSSRIGPIIQEDMSIGSKYKNHWNCKWNSRRRNHIKEKKRFNHADFVRGGPMLQSGKEKKGKYSPFLQNNLICPCAGLSSYQFLQVSDGVVVTISS